jgi:ATP-dependent DNA helicase PIF1
MNPDKVQSTSFDPFDFDSFISTETPVEVESVETINPDVEFLTGSAGTGKTYQIRQRQLTDANYGLMCATTGIAAINLGEGVTTINSALKFFDYNSLLESYHEGRLFRVIKKLIEEEGVKRIVIDEVSMLQGKVLDLIYNAFTEYQTRNGYEFSIVLTGDFCQLPPVTKDGEKIDWAFNANCWGKFEENTTKLTKVWRQSDEAFLAALNALRSGDGKTGVEILRGIKSIQWKTGTDPNFDGTTLNPNKAKAIEYNIQRLEMLKTTPFVIKSYKWSATEEDNPKVNYLKQWEDVPTTMVLKDEALVMIKSNDTRGWTYANGSLAHVKGMTKPLPDSGDSPKLILELVSNKQVIHLPLLVRQQLTKQIPDRFKKIDESSWPVSRQSAKNYPNPINPNDFSYYLPDKGKWCVAECIYFPVDYAWATTVHKSQGLTMDKVQIDIRPAFFGYPAMSYVALSRVRTPEGLTIVGMPSALEAKCKIASEVKRWL